jgi:hypothetical protein
VGGGAARGGAAAARGAGSGGRAAGRSGVLRPVRAVLRPAAGPAVHTDGGLPAADVPQVPLRARLREPVPRGHRFDHVAAVLPDPAGRAGAAPDHVDEADHPLRHGGGGRVQRGVAGQGRRGEAAAHDPAARGHHRRARGGGLPDRLRAAGQGGAADRRGRPARRTPVCRLGSHWRPCQERTRPCSPSPERSST